MNNGEVDYHHCLLLTGSPDWRMSVDMDCESHCESHSSRDGSPPPPPPPASWLYPGHCRPPPPGPGKYQGISTLSSPSPLSLGFVAPGSVLLPQFPPLDISLRSPGDLADMRHFINRYGFSNISSSLIFPLVPHHHLLLLSVIFISEHNHPVFGEDREKQILAELSAVN